MDWSGRAWHSGYAKCSRTIIRHCAKGQVGLATAFLFFQASARRLFSKTDILGAGASNIDRLMLAEDLVLFASQRRLRKTLEARCGEGTEECHERKPISVGEQGRVFVKITLRTWPLLFCYRFFAAENVTHRSTLPILSAAWSQSCQLNGPD
jgi:hypothetical protein